MRIIKRIYLLTIYICSLILIITSKLTFVNKYILACIIGLLPFIYFICFIVTKSVCDFWLGSFLEYLADNLSPHEFTEIISNSFARKVAKSAFFVLLR